MTGSTAGNKMGTTRVLAAEDSSVTRPASIARCWSTTWAPSMPKPFEQTSDKDWTPFFESNVLSEIPISLSTSRKCGGWSDLKLSKRLLCRVAFRTNDSDRKGWFLIEVETFPSRQRPKVFTQYSVFDENQPGGTMAAHGVVVKVLPVRFEGIERAALRAFRANQQPSSP